jgi:lia operon protein LiaG
LYNRIKTNFTSGDLQMDDVKMKYFDLKMTSGKTDVNNTTSDTLDIDITSGNIDIKGVFNDINAYATSGSMKIKTAVAPASLLINITSGNASVTIPDNEGFILCENKTSGFFHSDFKLDDYNTYKNGQNKYKIKITSGRVNLFKTK